MDEGNQIFRHLFERTDVGVQILRVEDDSDPGQLRLVALNEAASQLTGVDMTEFVGKTLQDSMPQYLESPFPRRYLATHTSGKDDSWETEYRDVRFPRAVWRSRVWRLDDRHVAVVFDNITEQRDAEEQLKARTAELERANARLEEMTQRVSSLLQSSEARLQALLDQTPAAVWNVSPDMTVQYLAGSALESISIDPQRDVGNPLRAVLRSDSPDDSALAAHERALQGESVQYEYVLDGRVFEAQVKPLRSESGTISGVAGAAVDVTERRQLQEAAGRSQRLESVGRLAGGIAHDFNNLLSIILNHAELLQVKLNGSSQADLAPILDAADQGGRLTNQLLAFARKQPARPRSINLNQVVQRMSTMLRHVVGKHVELSIDTAPNLGDIHADETQLEQVLMNLTINARDAMPDGGQLELRTERVSLGTRSSFDVPAGAYARLILRDTGRGIDAETLKHIFEPFFTTRESGTGLGLATVYGVVQQNRGAVRVQSTLGEGTTFDLVFPLLGPS